MANTINDLYLKYTNKVVSSLENDRYFQYMYEMLSNGDNLFQHSSQVLHKQIDEKWLSIIEDSLDSINNIIEKPRRFITTKEEVVPVSLAKKITADSIRHLSQNTQFIASAEEDDIQPTRILNVTVDETYDLYENRFVYHLIQRLVTFIDKRTDVLFWSTGDEKRNVMTMHSHIEDGYEEIEYKLEMKIKNRQSFAENESDNMDLFMRIDRVRRMVMALKNSSFCSIMAGCSKVRSPIQRTNLIIKDPDYKKCYKLWQFLESYDDVGYSIDVRNTNIEYDEEYLTNMYVNLITNYVVFKSLLEMDKRDVLSEVLKKHKVLKPKFVKVINEEVVKDEDYDLEDIEVRQVIVEEVTKAQLELEKKYKELNNKLNEVAAQRDEMGSKLETLGYQLETQLDDAERRLKEQKEKLLNEAREKEDKLNLLREEALDKASKLAEAVKNYQLKLEENNNELNSLKEINKAIGDNNKSLNEANDKLNKHLDELSKLYRESEDVKNEALNKSSTYKSLMDKAVSEKEEALKKCKEAQDKSKSDSMLREAAELNLKAQLKDKEDIESLNKALNDENSELKDTVEDLKRKLELALSEKAALNKKLDKEKNLRKACDAQLREANVSLKKSDNLCKDLSRELDEEKKLRVKAEKKAEGTVLSRYIISKLNGSKDEKDNS